MRPYLPFTLLLLSVPAWAGSSSGGGNSGGGGGRLSQVSSGIGTATGGGGAPHGGDGNRATSYENNYTECERYRYAREHDLAWRNTVLDVRCNDIIVLEDGRIVHRKFEPQPAGPAAHVEGSVAAEKVYESNGSVSLALAVVDTRFRLDGSLTHYYEDEMAGGRITMTVPELSVAVRVGEVGPTRVWLGGGVMVAKTGGDPMGNSSITGPTVGVRVEHQMSPKLSLVGTVEGAYFENNVRAWSGRAAVRWNHIEAAFRVLDFNVGPALFGPEVGIGF